MKMLRPSSEMEISFEGVGMTGIKADVALKGEASTECVKKIETVILETERIVLIADDIGESSTTLDDLSTITDIDSVPEYVIIGTKTSELMSLTVSISITTVVADGMNIMVSSCVVLVGSRKSVGEILSDMKILRLSSEMSISAEGVGMTADIVLDCKALIELVSKIESDILEVVTTTDIGVLIIIADEVMKDINSGEMSVARGKNVSELVSTTVSSFITVVIGDTNITVSSGLILVGSKKSVRETTSDMSILRSSSEIDISDISEDMRGI